MTITTKKCKRIIIKLSGEFLAGKRKFGINSKVVEDIAKEIKPLIKSGLQLGIVVGGGNFFRGATRDLGISRIAGDHLGIVSTILNALAMQDIFVRLNIPTKIMSALPIEGIINNYDYRRADE